MIQVTTEKCFPISQKKMEATVSVSRRHPRT